MYTVFLSLFRVKCYHIVNIRYRSICVTVDGIPTTVPNVLRCQICDRVV